MRLIQTWKLKCEILMTSLYVVFNKTEYVFDFEEPGFTGTGGSLEMHIQDIASQVIVPTHKQDRVTE